MKLFMKSLVITALSVQAFGASAAVLDLGVAGQYNAFIFNDFIDPSGTVQGALAVGHNLDITSYSINTSNKAVNGYSLVVGNNLHFSSGDVFNGNMYAGGTASGGFTTNGGTYGTSNPVNFASEQARLTALSSSLKQVQDTGTAEAKWGGIYLSATGTGAQVFNLNGADYSSATYINFTGFQAGQTIILNISGTSGIFNGGTGTNFSGYNALFNFYEAASVDTTNSANGTLLAPVATITGTGTVFGNVIANNWNAGTVGAGNYFQAANVAGLTITPVPEPESYGMLLVGLGLVGFLVRRRNAIV